MCRPNDRGEVAVIGAGVAGLVAAMALSEAGAQVSVYERSAQLGDEACSWLAGGMLAPYCERDGAEAAVAERGRLALDWWPRHVATQRCGSLVLAPPREQGELRRFARRTMDHRWLDSDALAALEPDLAGVHAGALWFEHEAHLDPRQALPQLAEALRRRGVAIRLHTSVRAEDLAHDAVVDCRGLAARDALSELRGVRGEMLLLRSRDLRLGRPLRLLHPRMPMYLVPRADGLLMLGATSIESEHAGAVTVRSALDLLGAACAVHPALAEAEIVEFGVGVRPAFPDNLPRLQRQGRVTFFNGLYRHGFLLAPWYAEHLASAWREPAEAKA